MSHEHDEPSREIRLSDMTAEGLLEIARNRKRILDDKTLLKIREILQARMENLDDDAPELGDTEEVLMKVQEMYHNMTDLY